ncbi:MAG: FAD-dependent oxidoreductase [Alphaproteobacteria bacterium]|nr:FAD-dependent oxidoreductase [Alphaproteobacteria bacterium]
MGPIEKKILKSDFCVIGAGSGGLSFAAGAVQMGASVILVESGKMGGDCLNYGCVPSKALLAAAKMQHHFQEATVFGLKADKLSVDFKKVHAHIQKIIANIAPHDSVERFESLGVNVVQEKGIFVDQDTLATDHYLIQAKRFIVATGSIPFVPPISGLSSIPYLTNETIFDLDVLPEYLVIIGGGPIGIEMAQAFIRLGSRVTVLEAFVALPKDDPQMTSKLKEILIQEGIEIKEYVIINSIISKDNTIYFSYNDADNNMVELQASHVLVATGRRPNIGALNLAAAKINASPQGIVVDAYLRTTNKRVYAIGDCIGGYQFTHVAGYHAGIVIRNTIFKLCKKVETRAIPWVTYTDPELAHIGALESDLIKQQKSYKVLEMSFAQNDRAQAERRTEGLIKVFVTPKGHILGATILGVSAGELIMPWVMAIQNNLKIGTIVDTIVPYPTLSDIHKQLAGSFYKDKIFSPFTKKIVRFLMWVTR